MFDLGNKRQDVILSSTTLKWDLVLRQITSHFTLILWIHRSFHRSLSLEKNKHLASRVDQLCLRQEYLHAMISNMKCVSTGVLVHFLVKSQTNFSPTFSIGVWKSGFHHLATFHTLVVKCSSYSHSRVARLWSERSYVFEWKIKACYLRHNSSSYERISFPERKLGRTLDLSLTHSLKRYFEGFLKSTYNFAQKHSCYACLS